MNNKKFEKLTPDEELIWNGDYHKAAVIVRGNVLNAATALEMSIDLYITTYFTEDLIKSEELMNLIISPRMSFENKVQVLLILLEKHEPQVLEQSKYMSNDLRTIIEERNILAHYPLDSTPSALKNYYETNNLTFFKFKNVREVEYKRTQERNKID